MKRLAVMLGGLALAVTLVVPNNYTEAAPTFAHVPGELLVKYRSGTDESVQASLRSNHGLAVRERLRTESDGSGLDLVALPSGANVLSTIARLKRDPNVEYAEPNWIYKHTATSTDPYYTGGQLWGTYGPSTSPANTYGTNAAASWAANKVGSSTVYVGVIDEGIQTTHPDLDANIWTNPFDAADGIDNDGNGYIDDRNGWDFAGGNNSVYDGGTAGTSDDHGTHVSGTIGAEANGSGVVGINWNVKLISAKFLGASGGTTANAVKAVDYITDLKTRHGLNIVATNNSWGGGGYSAALFSAIQRANNADILFIAAAGNNASNNDVTPHYPSSYTNSNIIAVASITSSGALSSFSNYGATSVDICAPGSAIWSTTAYNTYSSYNGTSMATPHVTGAVALFKASNPSATGATIKSTLLGNGVATASCGGKTVTGDRLRIVP